MMMMTTRSLKLHLLPLLLLSGSCVHAGSYDADHVARLASSERHDMSVSAQVAVVPPYILNALRSVSAGLDPRTAVDPDGGAGSSHSAVTLGLRN